MPNEHESMTDEDDCGMCGGSGEITVEHRALGRDYLAPCPECVGRDFVVMEAELLASRAEVKRLNKAHADVVTRNSQERRAMTKQLANADAARDIFQDEWSTEAHEGDDATPRQLAQQRAWLIYDASRKGKADLEPCGRCDGTGLIWAPQVGSGGVILNDGIKIPCNVCGGKGKKKP